MSMAAGNLAGRLGWAAVSDKIGRLQHTEKLIIKYVGWTNISYSLIFKISGVIPFYIQSLSTFIVNFHLFSNQNSALNFLGLGVFKELWYVKIMKPCLNKKCTDKSTTSYAILYFESEKEKFVTN